MLDSSTNVDLFNRYATGSDVAVVEGVMELFDGISGTQDHGSTAKMAKILGLPGTVACGNAFRYAAIQEGVDLSTTSGNLYDDWMQRASEPPGQIPARTDAWLLCASSLRQQAGSGSDLCAGLQRRCQPTGITMSVSESSSRCGPIVSILCDWTIPIVALFFPLPVTLAYVVSFAIKKSSTTQWVDESCKLALRKSYSICRR